MCIRDRRWYFFSALLFFLSVFIFHLYSGFSPSQSCTFASRSLARSPIVRIPWFRSFCSEAFPRNNRLRTGSGHIFSGISSGNSVCTLSVSLDFLPHRRESPWDPAASGLLFWLTPRKEMRCLHQYEKLIVPYFSLFFLQYMNCALHIWWFHFTLICSPG